MSNFTIEVQSVNGDPATSGANINITGGALTTITFVDVDDLLGATGAGEFVSFDGGTTLLPYTFLGFGDVDGDPLAHAGFIRVDLGGGVFETYAIDMNADGDNTPNLPNGNTKLKVADLDNTSSEPFPVCFCETTKIETNRGQVMIRDLAIGDLVKTLNNGYQPLLCVHRREWPADREFAPVVFQHGAIGNDTPLKLSPNHRVLVSGWRAELLFGVPEILVAAKKLVNDKTIRICPQPKITYCHLVFAEHEVIYANGAACESYLLDVTRDQLDRRVFTEICTLFPDLATPRTARMEPSHPVVSQYAAILSDQN
ncbi:MAG: Hint domain-containing protein [Planktomarina sp.]